MRYEKYKKFLSWNFEILNHNSDVFLRWMQCASISLEPVWGFLAALWDFLTLFQENEIFKGWKLQTDVMRRFFYSVKLWINFCSGRNISPPTSLKMILISVFFFFFPGGCRAERRPLWRGFEPPSDGRTTSVSVFSVLPWKRCLIILICVCWTWRGAATSRSLQVCLMQTRRRLLYNEILTDI